METPVECFSLVCTMEGKTKGKMWWGYKIIYKSSEESLDIWKNISFLSSSKPNQIEVVMSQWKSLQRNKPTLLCKTPPKSKTCQHIIYDLMMCLSEQAVTFFQGKAEHVWFWYDIPRGHFPELEERLFYQRTTHTHQSTFTLLE